MRTQVSAILLWLLLLGSSPATSMDLAANFWVNADYGSDLPFLDLMMMARRWTIAEYDDPGGCPSGLGYTNEYPWPCRDVPSSVTIPADSNGYPLQVPFTVGGTQYRVVTVMLAGNRPQYRPNGEYVLMFEGTGTIELGWDFGELQSYTGSGGMNRYTITISNPSYNPTWHGSMLCIKESSADDHIRNIHIVPAEHADDFQRAVFRDAFMKDLQPYSVLRFMDWCAANWSTDVTWDDRTTPFDFPQTNGFDKGTRATAYEYMILLCNKLRKDLWVCVPPQADENHQRALAEMIRDHLDPSLKVYIEWANETWNGGFWSSRYANQQGAIVGVDGWCYHGVAAAKLFHVFDEVFGGDVGTRVVKVLSGQHASSGVISCILDAFNNPTHNPWGTKADAIATAAYFSGSVGTGPLQTHKGIADNHGLDYICYEGGDKDGMYDTYRTALTVLDDYVSLFNQYTAVGMEWGAKQYSGQPANDLYAGPYRAMLEYAMANHGLDTSEAVVKAQAEPWWLPETSIERSGGSGNATVAPHGPQLVHEGRVLRVSAPGHDKCQARVRLFAPSGALVADTFVGDSEAIVRVDDLRSGLYVAEIATAAARVRRSLLLP